MLPSPPANPFSTRFTRPGAIDFLLAEDDASLASSRDLLMQWGMGAVVGPHGTGKSTFVQSLAAACCEADAPRSLRKTSWYRLRRGEAIDWRANEWASDQLIIVDGYEQLTAWKAWRIRSNARRAGAVLLVTAHSPPTGIPVLRRLTPSLLLAERVVDHLLGGDRSIISAADVAQCFAVHGDIRETLFALYDVFERRMRASGTKLGSQEPTRRV